MRGVIFDEDSLSVRDDERRDRRVWFRGFHRLGDLDHRGERDHVPSQRTRARDRVTPEQRAIPYTRE
jgi:hypothetical protein